MIRQVSEADLTADKQVELSHHATEMTQQTKTWSTADATLSQQEVQPLIKEFGLVTSSCLENDVLQGEWLR